MVAALACAGRLTACSNDGAALTAAVAQTTTPAPSDGDLVENTRQVPVEEPSRALLEFAAVADRICYLNYTRGIRNERRMEKIGRKRGWPGYQVEAAIHYGYEEAWLNEVRMMRELGDPPQLAGVMRRWVQTIIQRAQIRREMAQAGSRETTTA